MKKITLLTFIATVLFGWNTFSQISEDFETNPPAGWTFMQTEGDDPGFVQTDAQANSGTYSFYHNDDNIAVESTSWMISPSYTVAAGDRLTFYYYHNYAEAGYGVENGVWISTASADPIANPGDFTLLFDLLGNFSEDAWTEHNQNLDAYAGQTIYIAFKYVGDFEDELYIDDFSLDQTPTDELDYYNLQWPATGAINAGEVFDVYAQAYEAGLTDVTAGQAPGIESWIGYSSTDTDPSGTEWTWIPATFNVEAGNNDEYTLDLGAEINGIGTFYYASRWRLNGGVYSYGGIQADGSFGGIWGDNNNISGVLTIAFNCDNVIDLGTLASPHTSTTAGETNDFTGIDCLTNPGAPDILYSIVVPAGNTLIIGQTENGYDSKHRLAYGGVCPGENLVICTDDPDLQEVTWQNDTGSDQTAYWIQSAYSTGSGSFTLEWTLLACSNATVSYTVVNDCDISGGFLVDVEITDMGSATDITITDDQGSASQAATATGIYQFGPYVNGTDVVFTISDDNDASCTQTSATLTQEACPPVNDDCAGAIALTPGMVFSDNPVDGTVLGATDDTVAVGCGSDGPGVWYSVVVPADGNIIIEIGPDVATGNTGFDSVIEAFSGACGSLVSIDCDDDGAATGTYSLLDLTGQAPGTTIYIRVWEYGGNETEPFSISAYSSTLSIGDIANPNTFTYFPNPVKDALNLRAQSIIQNVSIYNMLGQEVMRTAPNAIADDVDMSALQTGTYFVKVTINEVTETIRVVKQ